MGLPVGQALSGMFRLLSATHADITFCFLESHTLFVSHCKPRLRWVREGSHWWWKAHCYQWMNQFFVFVCKCTSTFVRIRGTSVRYIASDPYRPGVTRDQLCWLIDAVSTSQAKYLGHFSHVSAISCAHISITSDDLFIFAVDKWKCKIDNKKWGQDNVFKKERHNLIEYKWQVTYFDYKIINHY